MRRVMTVEEIILLAENKMSVTGLFSGRRMPAMWAAHLPAILLHRQLQRGVYVYEKQEAKEKKHV